MQSEDALVQALVVENTEEARHGAVIEAAATAACRVPREAAHEASWRAWEAGHHGKTVRRAKATAFEKLLKASREWPLASSPVVSLPGGQRAVAYSPCRYASMPPLLRRLQVSGLALPDDLPFLASQEEAALLLEASRAPALVLLADLGLSTGKLAAQVSHAAGYHQALTGARLFPGAALAVASPELFEAVAASSPVTVRDSGLTELREPTATVTLFLPR